MPAQLETAPTKALDGILHGPSSATISDITLLDYRHMETFSNLWLNGLETATPTINGTTLDWTDDTKQIFLIGNDPPDGVFDTNLPGLAGINFRSHFTATSWLAAWKVKFTPSVKEKPEGKSEPMARIAVIDPRKPSLASGAAHALQTILSARTATGQTLVSRATVLNAPSLDGICQWLQHSKTDHRVVAKESPHLPDLLKATIWNELTSDREQHHALSNVLGAFLLSVQVGKGAPHPGDPWAQDFLLALVRACGIEADLDQVKLKETQRFQRWITMEQQVAIGGAVFIDDMGYLWEYFLRGALGFTGEVAFGTTDRSYRECLEVFGRGDFTREIAVLPGRLTEFFKSRRPLLTATDILGRESKLAESFVLFLDLRLFSGRPAGRPGDQEAEFLRGLAEFGITLLDSKRNLPWAHGESRESLRKELERFTERKPIAAGADEFGQPPSETILPRLVSLLDPTLPIIVFSSTHRTELIEPFRNYGNIVTTFHKPVLTGLAGDWVGMVREMHAGFTSAVDQAARILRVRDIGRPFYRPLQAN